MSIWIIALLDDIAMLADDASAMTKVSLQKTVWILWDDLAVNAKQASDFSASREIPVLWKITKWAFLNKLIILPFAFLLTAFAPNWVIPTILIFWWLYLSFEWTEKIHEILMEKIFHKKHLIWENSWNTKKEITEEEKVKSAIFTDFILSIEIIMIALWTVKAQSEVEPALSIQIIIVTIVALLAVIFVYWIVTLIVRLDDIWFYLINKWKDWSLTRKFWAILVSSLPVIIKTLAIVWTWAMLLVWWWIFTHSKLLPFHDLYHHTFNYLPSIIFDTILWFIAGYILVIIFIIWKKIIKK